MGNHIDFFISLQQMRYSMEIGVLMLKRLPFSITAVCIFAWISDAHGFDSQRFYPRSSTREEVLASQANTGGQPAGQFELGPSGRISKTFDTRNLNTFASTDLEMVTSDVESGVQQNDAATRDNLNISYSLSPPGMQTSVECGPSAMNPAEIEALVETTAAAYGVDPVLAKAIAWTESRFDQNRNSEQGARGAMQLMPRTARELGVTDICDSASNIDGGIRHLKLMLEKFQNPILATAAYNAGAQAVYDNGGVPPFPETVRYVAAVINHQMGLQMPGKGSARGIATEPAQSDEMASDVIGARGSRFVKGVMQF